MADEAKSSERSVFIAMDGSPNAEYAFNWYVKNIHKAEDKIVIGFCAEYPTVTYGSTYMLAGNPSVINAMIKEEEERMKKTVHNIETVVKNAGVGARIIRLYGQPGETIIKTASDEGAHLIVTGCRGMGTIRRTLLGSISDYIIHHSHIPVCVCRHDTH